VFAEAFSPDPDFFAFYRSMQAYDASLKGKGARFVVSPSSDFFRYFDRASGKAPPKP
jgi:membrane protease subunit HflC